jgi:hypothetical protein
MQPDLYGFGLGELTLHIGREEIVDQLSPFVRMWPP